MGKYEKTILTFKISFKSNGLLEGNRGAMHFEVQKVFGTRARRATIQSLGKEKQISSPHPDTVPRGRQKPEHTL